jgi:hypothetical protein
MKNWTCLALASMCLLGSSIAMADPLAPIAPKPIPAPTFRLPSPPLVQSIDPAATAIDFALVSRSSPFAGRVRVTGTVKNLGNAAYLSGANQQLAELFEIPAGGRPRLVASVPFQNLAPGAQVTVSFERDWNIASPAEGEFPPTYKVMVVYDPDIRLDGNPKNDDWNNANNVFERNGSAVRALF